MTDRIFEDEAGRDLVKRIVCWLRRGHRFSLIAWVNYDGSMTTYQCTTCKLNRTYLNYKKLNPFTEQEIADMPSKEPNPFPSTDKEIQ